MVNNPHDIAIRLENLLSREFKNDFAHSGTLFSADSIESYSFYDVISLILHIKSKRDCTEFLDKIYKYKGINMNQIPEYEDIYDLFISYLN